ncbi:hypothetical protein KXD40_006629 [Peronospora effusa]|uniref:Uncharacterized protein n=1 Tax=Peronospora effusa TaxID=542832 RepID=A0A3M6VD46_9STRA|nr:hypothetical protein DD238_004184 [Peronospora effusa]RQM17582.1 hypothetical protein DD237_003116 [Peronospora effusa]UIZ24690.1 hypothetical protein KXD40_006629 [Peronospora effusa]CAI5719601.1 unnamed protein product [Peronospora effusa]
MSPWIAIPGPSSAIIANNRTQVEIVDVSEPEETRNKDQQMVHMTLQVLTIALSACKESVEIEDAAGILSLYKVNETFLSEHSVCALYQVATSEE